MQFLLFNLWLAPKFDSVAFILDKDKLQSTYSILLPYDVFTLLMLYATYLSAVYVYWLY